LNLVEQADDGSVRFIHHHNELKRFPIDRCGNVRSISEESDGKLFVGTSLGLLVFDTRFEQAEQIRFIYYDSHATGAGTLSNSNIFYILHTRSGSWLATGGGGVNRVVDWDVQGYPSAFRAYTRRDGLASDVILSLAETQDSCVWMVSEDNITRFDPQAHTFQSFNEIRHLIGTNELFSKGEAVKTSAQEVLLGYSNGVFSFRAEDVRDDGYLPPLVFTRFRLFNREVSIGEDSPLKKRIDRAGEITLTHRQNFFSIEFATLDFLAPENIRYAYMLDGFDPEWNYSDGRRMANYTRLPHGRYTFRVKSTNAEGVWVDNERTLGIVMLPSFWETGWAWLFYALIVAGLIVGGAHILHTIFRLRHQVQLENHLTGVNIRFFTDISHEIRTPPGPKRCSSSRTMTICAISCIRSSSRNT
jgi:hypothetical protein